MLRKAALLVCMVVCGATWSFTQTVGYPQNEFFAGYSYHSADINTLTIDPSRTGQNGANLAFTRSVSPNIGIAADISAHFKRDSQVANGGVFERKRDQYYFLGGVQFTSRKNSRVTPFGRALAGASLFRGFTSNSTPAGNVYTFDDATSLAVAIGGGLDVPVSSRVSIRIIQADYIPTFFGSGHQNNVRLSFGIAFK